MTLEKCRRRELRVLHNHPASTSIAILYAAIFGLIITVEPNTCFLNASSHHKDGLNCSEVSTEYRDKNHKTEPSENRINLQAE